MYEQGREANTPPADNNDDRFRGSQAQTTVEGYTDRQSLLKDKRYFDTPAGKKDTVALARFKQKVALTDPAVYTGR
jgi:hypothetical protein